ncbi:hypothetical protein LOK49_LG01G00300 [Camellia lanceoleosa]|uniref:Uncharacterized protein n=1 Tax=Camellia lanceoleosa TaxID=1840588 RepID=A0ACC0IYX2_9ERIC|nr:hypothetical protein LOK49_LG01G00300 [Camellia lanceoleosa]
MKGKGKGNGLGTGSLARAIGDLEGLVGELLEIICVAQRWWTTAVVDLDFVVNILLECASDDGRSSSSIRPLMLALQHSRKPCSRYKLKEMTGSSIFTADAENGAQESDVNPTPNNKTGLRMYQGAMEEDGLIWKMGLKEAKMTAIKVMRMTYTMMANATKNHRIASNRRQMARSGCSGRVRWQQGPQLGQ